MCAVKCWGGSNSSLTVKIVFKKMSTLLKKITHNFIVPLKANLKTMSLHAGHNKKGWLKDLFQSFFMKKRELCHPPATIGLSEG